MSQPEIKLLKEIKENQQYSENRDEAEIPDFTQIRKKYKEENIKLLSEIVDHYFDRDRLEEQGNKKADFLENINHIFLWPNNRTILEYLIFDSLEKEKNQEQFSIWLKCLLESGSDFFIEFDDANTGKRSTRNIVGNLFNTVPPKPKFTDWGIFEILSEHIISEKKTLNSIISQPSKTMNKLMPDIVKLIDEYSPFIDFFYKEPDFKETIGYKRCHFKEYNIDVNPFNFHGICSFFESYSRRKNSYPKKISYSTNELDNSEPIQLSSLPEVLSEYIKIRRYIFLRYYFVEGLGRVWTTMDSSSRAQFDAIEKEAKEMMVSQPMNKNHLSPLYLFSMTGYTAMMKKLFEQNAYIETKFLKSMKINKTCLKIKTSTEENLLEVKFSIIQTILLESMFEARLDSVELLLMQNKELNDFPGVCLKGLYDSSKTGMTMPPLLWAVALQEENDPTKKFPSYYFVRLFLEMGFDLRKTTSSIHIDHVSSVKKMYETGSAAVDKKEIQELLSLDVPKLTALDLSLSEQNRSTVGIHEITDLLYLYIYRQIKTREKREPEPSDYPSYSCLERDGKFWNNAISIAEEWERNCRGPHNWTGK